MPVHLQARWVLAIHDPQWKELLLITGHNDGSGESCGAVVVGREREDDPIPNEYADRLLERYEQVLLDVLTASTEESAQNAIARFQEFAAAHVFEAREQALATRLILSAQLTMLQQFAAESEKVAAVAAALVALPCYRRMNQLNEMAIFARYVLERGRPELAWEPLTRAVKLVEEEISTHPVWLAEREDFRRILREVWESIPIALRSHLQPYPQNG
jgi:hypothetical protein